MAPAHTDTDIFVFFPKANVLHMGDVFFNGFYPFIDASTGGHIDGMIAGVAGGAEDRRPAQTKIVPGHGPVGPARRPRGVRPHAHRGARRRADS